MLNWTCPKCKKVIHLAQKYEVEQGCCSSCYVASWSDEKKAAFSKLFRVCFTNAPREKVDAATDEVLKHIET